MPQRPITQPPFLRGLIASVDPYSQPRGSFPRGSNLLLNRRGSLDTCDGTAVLFEYKGAVQTAAGRILNNLLFEPTGVLNYYLTLKEALSFHMNAPTNLTASAGGSGGTLATATYFYKVTAVDAAVGETTVSNEVSVAVTLGQVVTLTWNIVPNGTSYNVYRATSSNGEVLLIGTGLPVPQPALGTTPPPTVSFVDNGSAVSGPSYQISQILVTEIGIPSGKPAEATVQTLRPVAVIVGQSVAISGNSNSDLNGTFSVMGVSVDQMSIDVQIHAFIDIFVESPPPSYPGGTLVVVGQPGVSPPTANTTRQTALYKMPTILAGSTLPLSYSDSNIVALFPAVLPFVVGQSTTTVNGGAANGLCPIPEMLQFTNRLAMALGNGFAPQIYSDPTTKVNTAQVLAISSVTETGGDTATFTLTAPPAVFVPVGSNILVAGVANAQFDGVYVVLGGSATVQAGPGTQLIVRNVVAVGTSSGGTVTVTTVPVYNTFVPVFPKWITNVAYPVNSVVQPTTAPSNLYFFTAIQGGTSGAVEPTWPTALGSQVADNDILWKNSGPVNAAAPPPPGAAHIAVYAGALWVWNTSYFDTAPPTGVTGTGQVGLDGPASLRQSDVNTPFSWNPINQAFIDRDDGSEGMGLKAFTVTAQGIPPEGSLVAFKNFATFQIIGVFGASDFAIQRIKSDMGNIAPRTLQFVPGYGLMRYTHLGIAVFDGVEDKIVSEEIRPYLFLQDDIGFSDITVVDQNFLAVSWAAQTATPPMYCLVMPIGNSSGGLTRIFCYDMVLKAWTAPVDLPFSLATLGQFRQQGVTPLTVTGGFLDGTLQRWQAGDTEWYGGDASGAGPLIIQWNFKTAEAFADPAQRLYVRRVFLRLINTTSAAGLTATPYLDGTAGTPFTSAIFGTGDTEIDVPVQVVALRFSLLVSGTGQVEIDRVSWLVTPKPAGVPRVLA